MGTWIVMPKLSRRMKEGGVGLWLAQPGERVVRGQPLLEIVTEKVIHELSAPVDGTLARVLVATGQTVPVGTRLAYLED